MALGSAYLALVDDATAGYWNPAALSGVKRGAHLMHSERFGGLVDHDFAAVALERFLWFDGFAVSLLRLGVSDIEFTTLQNPVAVLSPLNRPLVASTESSSDYAAYFSGGRRLSDRLDLGASLKLLYRSVANFSAYGFGLDMGLRYRLRPGFVIAATVRDVTTSPVIWDGASDRIEPSLGLGIALSKAVGSGRANFSLGSRTGGDASDAGDPSPLLAGIEYDVGKLALRAGLQEERQTFGVGLRARDELRLDLAYQQHDQLEATYVFSASVGF